MTTMNREVAEALVRTFIRNRPCLQWRVAGATEWIDLTPPSYTCEDARLAEAGRRAGLLARQIMRANQRAIFHDEKSWIEVGPEGVRAGEIMPPRNNRSGILLKPNKPGTAPAIVRAFDRALRILRDVEPCQAGIYGPGGEGDRITVARTDEATIDAFCRLTEVPPEIPLRLIVDYDGLWLFVEASREPISVCVGLHVQPPEIHKL